MASGDSNEQNGSFKIYLAEAKAELLSYRVRFMIQDLELQATDIIPLINIVWDNSYARVHTNLKAICNRGWYPYNRNLLLHADFRGTVTEEEKGNERKYSYFFPSLITKEIDITGPSFEVKYK